MIPVKLDLKYFLCYKDESLDFTKLDPITLINGISNESGSKEESNGSGKSSLLDAILWNLYGRVRGIFNKDLVKDDVVRIDSDGDAGPFARVIYIFQLKDVHYKVIREKAYEGAQSLELYVSKIGGTWNNLTLSPGFNKRAGKKESSISRTQQRIDDILNANCDLFINSVFCEQGNTNTFATSKQGEREDLLKEALYLDKWTDYGKEGKDRLRKVEKDIYAVEYNLKQNNTDELEDSISEAEQIKKDATERLSKERERFSSLTNRIKSLRALAVKYEAAQAKYASLGDQVNLLQEKSNDLISQSEELTENIKDENQNLEDAQFQIDAQDQLIAQAEERKKELDEQVDDTDYLKMKEDLIAKIAGENTAKEFLNNLKSELNEGICPQNSPTCVYNSEENKEKKLIMINSKIFKLNGSIRKKSKKQKELDEAIKFQKEWRNCSKAILETQDLIEDYKTDIKKCEESIDKYEEKKKKIDKQQLKASQEYKAKKKEFDELDQMDVEETNEELTEQETELTSCNETIEKSKATIAKAENNIEHYNEKSKEIEKLQDKFNTLNDRQRLLQYVVKMLMKDIPHQLVEAAIPEIENYAVDFMEYLSGGRYSLRFSTQRELRKKDKESGEKLKSDHLDLILDIDGIERKYSLCSGGQRTRADLAVHFGYAVFLLNRSEAKLETLFLDEVASALDKDGRDRLISLLDRLVNEFGFKKIFLISQDDKLNKLFDSILTIKSTSEGSKICYL